MQYEFGTGVLYGKSLNSGVQTPVRFGALQGVTVDFAFTTKELYGQYQFPLALALVFLIFEAVTPLRRRVGQ